MTTVFEKGLSTFADNIEHIESTSYNGVAVIKAFLQPDANVATANAQTLTASQYLLRLLPPAIQPPEVISFSASSVPVVQLGLTGMSEQQLQDSGFNFLRSQLITVPGTVIPYPYRRQQQTEGKAQRNAQHLQFDLADPFAQLVAHESSGKGADGIRNLPVGRFALEMRGSTQKAAGSRRTVGFT